MFRLLNSRLLTVLVVCVFSFPSLAQDNKARPITRSDTLQITLHRAKTDTVGNVQFLDNNDYKLAVENALSEAEIEAGFKANEKIVLRVTSPYPFFIYIVNASDWEGVNLVYPYKNNKSQNKQFEANSPTDFAYEFVPDGKTTTGREEYFVLISKAKIENPKLEDIMKNDGKIILTQAQVNEAKKELNNTTEVKDKQTKKKSKWTTLFGIGCNAASLFFPFVNNICTRLPLGARPIFRDKSTIDVVPNAVTDQIAFRLSFRVTK
jgi:hypothetical protein